MYHLEVVGTYWDGLVDEAIEHLDAAGIDQAVVLATWMDSRRSNEITRDACRRYPDRFIPFGHVRPVDDWKSELRRLTQEFGWTGLKLHQGELRHGGPDMGATAHEIVEEAAGLGVRLVKLHLVEYDAVDRLTGALPNVTWILPHLGCYGAWRDMERYCALARRRPNVYLDTCAVDPYYDLGKAFQWAGADKVTFASDGHEYSPLVEKAKIDTLRLPTPFRTPRLTDEEYAMVMGGTMARLLGLEGCRGEARVQ